GGGVGGGGLGRGAGGLEKAPPAVVKPQACRRSWREAPGLRDGFGNTRAEACLDGLADAGGHGLPWDPRSVGGRGGHQPSKRAAALPCPRTISSSATVSSTCP